MMEEKTPHFWTTVNKYVDIESGEEITKEMIIKKNYRVINKLKIIEHGKQGKYISITNECKRNGFRQLSIDFKE